MNPISPELQEKFAQILKRGDEVAARRWLMENLKNFPEDVQDGIITALVEEALRKETRGEKIIDRFQAESLTTLDDLGSAREEVDKQLQLKRIKDEIRREHSDL